MPSPHSFESLQARLSRRVDTSDTGDTLPLTAQALAMEDPAQRLVALVHALQTERLIVPAQVEKRQGQQQAEKQGKPGLSRGMFQSQSLASRHGDRSREGGLAQSSAEPCATQSVATTPTDQGPALVAFTSVDELQNWDEKARPLPMEGQNVGLLAVAQTQGRLVVNPSADNGGVRIPRPAAIALAHADTWLPAWQDAELAQLLSTYTSPEIAFVRLEPSSSAVQRLTVGVTPAGHANRAKLVKQMDVIAKVARLQPAAEIIQIVPVPVALA